MVQGPQKGFSLQSGGLLESDLLLIEMNQPISQRLITRSWGQMGQSSERTLYFNPDFTHVLCQFGMSERGRGGGVTGRGAG